jgi:hypothetical protein
MMLWRHADIIAAIIIHIAKATPIAIIMVIADRMIVPYLWGR